MTFEDFFTFSELNNGLTNPSRVTELVAVIEKETDSSCKNAGDLTKQWSTFARAITSTENKECLDLFVQLDGLKFIAKLLGNAQRLVSEETDTSIEDTITNLLQAVETFQVDRKKLLDSELLTIVKELLVHSSPKVHVRARVLCEHWENKRVIEDISLVDKERSSTLTDDGKGENQNIKKGSDSYSSLGNTDTSQETPTDKEKTQELTRDATSPSTTGDIVVDNMDGLRNNSSIILDPIETEKTTVESAVSKIEQLMSHEEPRPSEGTSDTESSKNLCDAPSPMGLTIDADVKVPSDASGDAKECEGRFQDLKEFGRLRTVHEADGQVKRRNLLTSGCDLASSYGLGKKSTTDSEATAKSGKRSDNNFDYGIVDPLDIARQVAIEVEREVGDYRERSCNSPENNTRQAPESSESVSREEFNGSGDDSNDRSNIDSDNDSKTNEETMSQNTDAEQINDDQNMAVSQVSEGATTETNSQKILCDFDLNQVSSEAENPTSHDCTPVSVVSASRATAALALPGPPLQSDGNLGWKSSASSAFQPEKKTHGGESSGSKKHEVFLGFDLNVAADWDSGYYHRNGESYAETSSRKPDVFSLDLNHASEPNNGPPRDWLATGNFLPTQSVGQQTSSSSKQPISFLDLNDQPSLLNSSSYNSNFSRLPPAFDAFGVSKPKETEFSLFGAKVEVKAKGNAHTPTMSLQNGRTHDLAYNPNNMRQAHSFFGMGPPPPMVQYTSDPSVYGYNNMQLAGPTIPAIYGSAGPIPYMVDTRGSPAMPQIMGSVSPFPIPYSQPPFAANTMNSILNPPSNDAKNCFDLNPRTMMMAESLGGGGSSSTSIKESSSFGQFLNLGQFRSMDERVRPTSQHTVAGQKRKEPENGWENYGYRPHMPPWK